MWSTCSSYVYVILYVILYICYMLCYIICYIINIYSGLPLIRTPQLGPPRFFPDTTARTDYLLHSDSRKLLPEMRPPRYSVYWPPFLDPT